MTENWWETPIGAARLAYEISEIEKLGIPVVKDREAFAAGIARLILEYPVNSGTKELRITFPDFYPYFRFAVTAPSLDLHHHQHPFAKVLCVLGRNSIWWAVTDTVAAVLTEQMPKLLVAGEAEEGHDVSALEEAQAEPFSDYFRYAESIVLIDGSWQIPVGCQSGTLKVGLMGLIPDSTDVPTSAVPRLQACVLEVQGDSGTSLFRAAQPWWDRYSQYTIRARWSYLRDQIVSDDPDVLFQSAEALDSQHGQTWEILPPSGLQRFRVQVRGVVFREEVGVRTLGQGWIFVVRTQMSEAAPQPSGGSKFAMRSQKSRGPGSRWRDRATYIARAGRAGADDIVARSPELTPLRAATVCVVGAGCIGAPSVLEFARAGVREVRLVEPDIVDPGTVGRWPLGFGAAGQLKVRALSGFIGAQYPYTNVVVKSIQIGAVRDSGPSQVAVLNEFLQGASLVFDATADWGVQRFLSAVARARRMPYIAVSGTHGGWGGTVVRVRPGASAGCWLCWRLNNELPSPPAGPIETLQPAGCADPTFKAAGFDMTELAMQAVRLAVSTLCDGADGYPPADWDVASVAFRDAAGLLIQPGITTSALPRHPSCPECSSREDGGDQRGAHE